jgi:hypothetical protein
MPGLLERQLPFGAESSKTGTWCQCAASNQYETYGMITLNDRRRRKI